MKRLLLMMAALVAAISVYGALTLPAPTRRLAPGDDGSVPGDLHVHTIRSDGRGTADEIAQAAARAGLRFVVLTDHGDATRTPDPPTYRSGVLCLDGVEISTTGGHYVAFDMPAAPYPLAGEPRDVVEDVHRLGGFGIAAHPDSPKADLRWRDWTVPYDGLEWVNPDTSWRVHVAAGWRGRLRLADALLHYPMRPAETLASLLTGAEAIASHWDAAAATRRVVITAGVDAHAKLAVRNAEPGDNRYALPIPGYAATFGTLAVLVRPDEPLSGDATHDGRLIVAAIRAGHLHTVINGVASPAAFEFTASNARGTAREGDELAAGGALTLRVRSNAPTGFVTTVWRGSRVIATETRQEFVVDGGEGPDVYRVDIRSGDASSPLPWLLSNPIYVRAARAAVPLPPRTAPSSTRAIFDGRTTAGWHLETDPMSVAAVDTAQTIGGTVLRLRYGLAGIAGADLRAALVWGPPLDSRPGLFTAFDRLTFTAHAERPMRVSLQLRTPDVGRTLRRWQRSVYLDTTDRTSVVPFDEMLPSLATDPARAPLAEVNAVLLVIDTTNTKAGSSGRIWIKDVSLQR